jgi:hypothetical protein
MTKPHFLLWPKCYQKLTTLEEEQWLLRALDASLSSFSTEVEKSETLRSIVFFLRDDFSDILLIHSQRPIWRSFRLSCY